MSEPTSTALRRPKSESEAKELVSEARRILRKKSYRIPESVTAEVEAAIGEVTAAVLGPDPDRLSSAMTDLDGKLEQHLGFARKSTTREYVESILVAVAIALLLRTFVVEAFQIPSGSMIPTLEIGDHIFVSKFSYGLGIPFTNKKIFQWSDPKRGDVIVFKFPLSTEIDYIKRVVGLPGETVEVRRNEIFINGRSMAREHLDEPCTDNQRDALPPDGLLERDCDLWRETLEDKQHKTRHDVDREPADFGPKVVPPDSVFVMGDNRDNSNDSRVWGTVQRDLIKGRALIVWWSRGPTEGELSLQGLRDWFAAIRWRRFFHAVE
jgi:signal peptidase I